MNTAHQHTQWRYLCSILLGCILFTIFSGCQKLPQAQGNTSSETTLTLSIWGSATEKAIYTDLVSQFEKTHPGIQVLLRHVPENYFQKLHILMAADLAPDVMMMNSFYLPVYSDNDLLMSLDTSKLFSSDFLPSFYPNALNALRWKHQLYALPRDVSDLVMYINRGLVRNANAPMPKPTWTMDDYVALAKQLTKDTNQDGTLDQFGTSFYEAPPLFWLPFLWSHGGQVWNSSQHLTLRDNAPENICLLTQPNAQKAIRFYADVRQAEHVAPRKTEVGGTTMTQLFIQQKIATMVSGRWAVPVLRKSALFDWDVLPFPHGSSGSKVGIDATGYSVSANTKHPQESQQLVAFLTSDHAIKVFTDSGLIVPAKPSVAKSPSFLQPGQKPTHSQAFLAAIDTGVPTHSHPRWNQISETLRLTLEPAFNGSKSVSESTEAACKQLKPLLAPTH